MTEPRTAEARIASHPDDPDAPFAHRLLLALGMWPSYIDEIGEDVLVEAAVKIRTAAHKYPMAAEDYGTVSTQLEAARRLTAELAITTGAVEDDGVWVDPSRDRIGHEDEARPEGAYTLYRLVADEEVDL